MANETLSKEYLKQRKLAHTLGKFELDLIDMAMLKLYSQYPQITDKEVGIIVELTSWQVNRRKNKDKFQGALRELFSSSQEIIDNNVTKAARKYVELLDDSSYIIVEKAARTILQSAGIFKSEQPPPSNNEMVIINISPNEKIAITAGQTKQAMLEHKGETISEDKNE